MLEDSLEARGSPEARDHSGKNDHRSTNLCPSPGSRDPATGNAQLRGRQQDFPQLRYDLEYDETKCIYKHGVKPPGSYLDTHVQARQSLAAIATPASYASKMSEGELVSYLIYGETKNHNKHNEQFKSLKMSPTMRVNKTKRGTRSGIYYRQT